MNINNGIKFLEKDKNRYVGFLECLKYDETEFLYAENDGVMFYDKTAGIYFLATSSEESCKKAIDGIEKTDGVALCVNEYEYLSLKNKFGYDGLNRCKQIVWEGKEPLPLKGICEVKRLEPTKENVEVVFNHYTLHYTREHIKYIMENLGIYGGYVNGEIVGFIGRHEEHSIGMLEVFPEFRRRGYAEEIEKSVLNILITKGEIPYAHIIDDNVPSLTMHKNMGYSFSKGSFYWLFYKN